MKFKDRWFRYNSNLVGPACGPFLTRTQNMNKRNSVKSLWYLLFHEITSTGDKSSNISRYALGTDDDIIRKFKPRQLCLDPFWSPPLLQETHLASTKKCSPWRVLPPVQPNIARCATRSSAACTCARACGGTESFLFVIRIGLALLAILWRNTVSILPSFCPRYLPR